MTALYIFRVLNEVKTFCLLNKTSTETYISLRIKHKIQRDILVNLKHHTHMMDTYTYIYICLECAKCRSQPVRVNEIEHKEFKVICYDAVE